MTEPSADLPLPAPRVRLFMFLAIVALAAFLRFYTLDAQSLWYDEMITREYSGVPLSHLLATNRQIDNAPPGYPLVVWLCCKAFGNSDAALRLPSAVAGVASVPMLYLLARRLFASHPRRDTAALVACLLLAVSRYHVAYSQEARAYGVMFCCALASCYFVSALLTSRHRGLQAGYVLATACMFWAHPYSVLVLFCQTLFLLAYLVHLRRTGTENAGPSPRGWFTLLTAAVLLYGPWIPVNLSLLSAGQPSLTRQYVLPVYLSYAGSLPMLLLVAAASAIAVLLAVRRRDLSLLLPALLATIPPLLPLALATDRYPTFTDRYGIAALIGLFCCTAYGLAALARPLTIAAAGLVLALVTPAYYNDLRYHTGSGHKNDVRAAAHLIMSRATPGDAWACSDFLLTVPFRRYVGPDLPELTDLHAPPPPGRVWYVLRTLYEAVPSECDVLAGTPYHVLSRTPLFGVTVLELSTSP